MDPYTLKAAREAIAEIGDENYAMEWVKQVRDSRLRALTLAGIEAATAEPPSVPDFTMHGFPPGTLCAEWDGPKLGLTFYPDAEPSADVVSDLRLVQNLSAEVAKLREDAEQDEKAYLRQIASLEDETRCPECGCATPDDAEAGECGCDSPVCARTSTLAESYAASFAEVAKLRAERDALRERLRVASADEGPAAEQEQIEDLFDDWGESYTTLDKVRAILAERDALKTKLAKVTAALEEPKFWQSRVVNALRAAKGASA